MFLDRVASSHSALASSSRSIPPPPHGSRFQAPAGSSNARMQPSRLEEAFHSSTFSPRRIFGRRSRAHSVPTVACTPIQRVVDPATSTAEGAKSPSSSSSVPPSSPSMSSAPDPSSSSPSQPSSTTSSTPPTPGGNMVESRRAYPEAAEGSGATSSSAEGSSATSNAAKGSSVASEAAEDRSRTPRSNKMSRNESSEAWLRRQEKVKSIRKAAKAKRNAGRLHAAMRLLEDGLEEFPGNSELVALAAPIYTKLGNPKKALELLYTGLEKYPTHTRFITGAASAEGKLGNFDRARELYQRGLEVDKKCSNLIQSWALMEAAARNEKEARRLFEKALSICPNRGAFYNAWALFEAGLGNGALARQLWEDGGSADPNHVPLLHAWAEFELAEGQEGFARELLMAATELDSSHIPASLSMGKLEWHEGQYEAARGYWKQGVGRPRSTNGDLANVGDGERSQRGSASVGADEGESEGFSAEEEVEEDTSSAHVLCYWARHEMRLCRHSKARELLARALELDPGNVYALHISAMMEDRAGNANKANLIYEKMMHAPEGSARVAAVSDGKTDSDSSPGSSAAVSDGKTDIDSSPGSSAAVSDGKTDSDSSPGSSAAVSDGKTDSDSSPGSSAAVGGQRSGLGGFVGVSVGNPDEVRSPNPAYFKGRWNGPGVGVGVPGPQVDPAGPFSVIHPSNSASPQLLHARAQFLIKRGMLDEANQYLDMIETVDPDNAFLCHTRGQMAVSSGEFKVARSWFAKGTGRHNREQMVAGSCSSGQGVLLCYEGLAKLLSFQGHREEARAIFNAGLEMLRARGGPSFAPGSVAPRMVGVSSAVSNGLGLGGPTRFLREYALFEKHNSSYEAASELFRRAAKLDPQDYKTWTQWAVLERRRGRFEVAQLCFSRGVALAPGNPHIWYTYAVMIWMNGDVSGARKIFKQATANCPRNAPLWMEWALMEQRSGNDLETARTLFQRGSKVPAAYQHPPLYVAWSQLEAEAGNEVSSAQLLKFGQGWEKRKQHLRSKGQRPS